MATFEDLPLGGWMKKQLKNIGLSQCTPVQRECIPVILAGRDCCGCAKTGSGKTLAFAAPILQKLSEDPYGIFALVVTPSRELAFQISDQFNILGKVAGVRVSVIVGGRDMMAQGLDLANKPHIVVATPGRLADHIRSCATFSLKRIRYLVIDEADRMFDGSFDAQLSDILAAVPPPKSRQTLLFTATVSDTLRKLMQISEQSGKNPFFFEETPNSDGLSEDQLTPETLEQKFVMTPVEARDGYLVQVTRMMLERFPRGCVLVFVRTCRDCEVLGRTLDALLSDFAKENETSVVASLHSRKSQRDRLAALAAFRSGRRRVLVATDVASRGLDIPIVEVVVNHDVPAASRSYVHRVGRSGRAGRAGLAVTLVTPHDVDLVKAIETHTKAQLEEMPVDDNVVAEILAQVSVTRREQEVFLDGTDFDEKRNVHKRKRLVELGLDPEEVEREKKRDLRKRRKAEKKELMKKIKEQKGKTLEESVPKEGEKTSARTEKAIKPKERKLSSNKS